MNLTSLTSADLTKITNLLKTKESLLAKVAEIDKSLTAFESSGTVVVKKSKMSQAARKKIAAAQKKRWAKINKGKKTAKPGKKKFTMSAAAKAKISAARKEYWAKRKAAEAKK